RGGRERVDRAPLRPLTPASLERARRHLGRGPLAATASRLVLGDRAGERIGRERHPRRTRERDERGELCECLTACWRHDEWEESASEGLRDARSADAVAGRIGVARGARSIL